MENTISAFSIYSRNKSKSNQMKPNHNRVKKKKRTKQKMLSNTGKQFKKFAQAQTNGVKLQKKVLKAAESEKRKEKNLKPKKKKAKSEKLKGTHTDLDSTSDNLIEQFPIFDTKELEHVVEINGNNDTDTESDSIEFSPVTTDSVEEGLKAFQWLIAPYDPHEFLNKIWERKPLHICRKNPDYYKGIISTPLIDHMLRNENIIYTKNIDITSYTNGKRETHNPVGRAHPHAVWDYYLNGCSIRLLNPQTYLPRLHLLNATLQEFMHSFVGANAYLTPPDSQGFAPHYDDIEAFIMQVEGKKHWKIYKPLNDAEFLPRVSSKNFSQDEIGEPILETTLEAGDMLYFPRGYIHQGVTINGEHSLHVTVSMYQKHSFADLFEKMLPAALESAITKNVDFRKGLPFDIYDNFGLANKDIQNERKDEIRSLISSMFYKIVTELNIDASVDEMAKIFQHSALPPVLSTLEKAVTVHDDCDMMVENGQVTKRVEIELDTKIRLLRKNILRMVVEEDGRKVYYHSENSLEYQANDLQFIDIDESLAPVIETLLTRYPDYVSVENLNIEDNADKIQIVNYLWEKGLIMTEYPLEYIEDF